MLFKDSFMPKRPINALSASATGEGALFLDETGGVALILVMWVIVVLMAIVGEFSYSMRTEINITRNFKEEEEAYNLALAGIEKAKAELLTAKDPALMYVNEEDFLVFDPEGEPPQRKVDLGKGKFEYTLSDEDGKLNLNTATPEQLRTIFQSAGVEGEDLDVIVDSIQDWRDTDDLHMLNGAEDDYYESLDSPYSSKDGPFDSPEELLLVKGMTPEIFYGSAPAKEGEEEEVTYQRSGDYFTVFGSGSINIKTASQAVLEVVAGPDVANLIIAQRNEGIITATVPNGKMVSEFFNIRSTGYNGDGTIKRTIKIIIHKNGEELETVYWNDNIIG